LDVFFQFLQYFWVLKDLFALLVFVFILKTRHDQFLSFFLSFFLLGTSNAQTKIQAKTIVGLTPLARSLGITSDEFRTHP